MYLVWAWIKNSSHKKRYRSIATVAMEIKKKTYFESYISMFLALGLAIFTPLGIFWNAKQEVDCICKKIIN